MSCCMYIFCQEDDIGVMKHLQRDEELYCMQAEVGHH